MLVIAVLIAAVAVQSGTAAADARPATATVLDARSAAAPTNLLGSAISTRSPGARTASSAPSIRRKRDSGGADTGLFIGVGALLAAVALAAYLAFGPRRERPRASRDAETPDDTPSTAAPATMAAAPVDEVDPATVEADSGDNGEQPLSPLKTRAEDGTPL